MNKTELCKYLSAPIEHSIDFTDSINQMATCISTTMNIAILHEDEMNYSASQLLVAFLDENNRSTIAEQAAKFKIVFYVSSKCKCVSYLVFTKSKSNEWCKSNCKEKEADLIIEEVVRILSEIFHYELIISDALNDIPGGYKTEMDGKPATIFEIIFSEVI